MSSYTEFNGKIVLVKRHNRVQQALSLVGHCDVLGFDMEWEPDQNSDNPPRLIQLSSLETCLVFDMYALRGIPGPLRALLQSPSVLKICVDPRRSDCRKLRSHYGLELNGYRCLIEEALRLRFIRHKRGYGLGRLAQVVLDCDIDKGLSTSAWGSDFLSSEQIRYAATDAWITLKIWLAMITHQSRSEDEAKNSECFQCGRSFLSRASCQQHQNATGHYLQCDCKDCGRFYSHEQLDDHLDDTYHHPISCNYCGKDQQNFAQYESHLDDSHTARCQWCSYEQRCHSPQSELAVHFDNAHRKGCELCDRVFECVDPEHALEQHEDSVHRRQCHHCDRDFFGRNPRRSLSQHLWDVHHIVYRS